jgi:hypothetical protein
MWYLITIEPDEFLKLHVQQGEVRYKFQGKDNGTPVFDVDEGLKKYSIEVYDETYKPYYLDEIYTINPSGFTCINHNTVLLEWNEEEATLTNTLNTILYKKDKYAVFKISELLSSNFLPVEYLNQLIVK